MSTVKDKILSIEVVAKLKGVNSECIRAAIRKGKLKATYFHGKWHIRESSYFEYDKRYHQYQHNQKFITLEQALKTLKISQELILRAVQKGAIETREDKQGFQVCLDSLLEWDRGNFVRNR